MELSIIIVTWNSQRTLSNCLSSIFRFSSSIDLEILIVDNASADTKYVDAYSSDPRVKIFKNKENLGFSKANNIALKAARGQYLLILNPDVVFLSDSASRLITKLKEHPEIGVIGPLLIGQDNLPQIQGYYFRFPSHLQVLCVHTLLARIGWIRKLAAPFVHSGVTATGLSFVDQIPGAFMLFHRELMAPLPLLNEDYFIWMEDVDFCRKIASIGRRVAVLSDEKAKHLGGASFALWPNGEKKKAFMHSYQTYLALHQSQAGYLASLSILFLNSAISIVMVVIKNILLLRWKRLKSIFMAELYVISLTVKNATWSLTRRRNSWEIR